MTLRVGFGGRDDAAGLPTERISEVHTEERLHQGDKGCLRGVEYWGGDCLDKICQNDRFLEVKNGNPP